jgi:hypothetical protein
MDLFCINLILNMDVDAQIRKFIAADEQVARLRLGLYVS